MTDNPPVSTHLLKSQAEKRARNIRRNQRLRTPMNALDRKSGRLIAPTARIVIRRRGRFDARYDVIVTPAEES